MEVSDLSDKEFKPLEIRMLTKYGEVKDEQNKNFEQVQENI